MFDRILNKTLIPALININFLFGLFNCKQDYLLYLDSTMNNTTLKFQYPQPPCTLLHPNVQETFGDKQVLTPIYATFIPLTIIVNLLCIIGIIKTKRKTLNSSEVLLLTLFVSDMTVGALQLPMQIFIYWKTNNLTCFENQLIQFLYIFPICMSGSLLCAIAIDRYINVMCNTYYKRIVTKKALPVVIAFVIINASIWATFEIFLVDVDKRKVAIAYFVFAISWTVVHLIVISFNVAILIKVKKQTQISTARQRMNLRLMKTIAMIVATYVVAYLPLTITLNILTYAFMNSTDINFLKNLLNIFYITLVPAQLNAGLNSIIYLARNSNIKKYYYNLVFHGRNMTTD